MNYSLEIAHLMRTGTAAEIEAYFKKRKVLEAEKDFYSFINDVIDRSPYKRADVAQRAGLSRDYTYKLLRGDKRTTERDYILAICFALNMDIQDAQEALRLYPFPILQDRIPRSAVIKAGFTCKIGLDMMNDWLTKASFPLIRTSPDMPSARLRETRSSYDSQSTMKVRERKYYVNVLTDPPFVCSAEMLLTDDDGFTNYISMDNDALYLSSASLMDTSDKSSALRVYPDLPSASDSPFFKYYLEMSMDLDRELSWSMEENHIKLDL